MLMGTSLVFCLDKHYPVQGDKFPTSAKWSFQDLDMKANTT